jgi:beta-barrel assembly-enhancing protease
MRRQYIFAFTVILAAGAIYGQDKLPKFKPGWNLFSNAQDIQLGKEAAGQVEQQYQVVKEPTLEAYINTVGKRLASQPLAESNKWPYYFRVVNDPSINAFALPGGPMYVHTGLLKAVENESQLAGVLAHEMSHVVLRHGTNQATKANALQLPLVLAGAVTGAKGGILGQLSQMGLGLGANSVLLRFSRDAEKQADLLGAQIMAGAGYNPVEMARFFEKLEKESGSKTPQFLSDHPNPGNRVKYVSEEAQLMPQREFNADTGQLAQAKQLAAAVPPPPAKPKVQAAGSAAAPSASVRPSGALKAYSAKSFGISYPDNWKTFGDPNAGTVTIAPQEALFQDTSGNTAIGYGTIVSYYHPQDGKVDLQRDTAALVQEMMKSNSGMQVQGSSQAIKVGGIDGLQTVLSSKSPYQGQTEADVVVTVPRPEGLYYMVFIAPQNDFASVRTTFQSMIQSVKFVNQ